MKKTILLAGIIASMTTMANVTGFVEGNAKGDVTFAKEGKETKVTGNIDDLSVKGEVKVNKLTLGAVLKNKDIKEISKVKPLTTEMYTENLLDNSSVYAKYELPEFSGIKSYVKGTLNPKAKYEADGTLNFKKGNVELEGQLAHSFSNGAEVSLTSKTTFPFEKKDGEYGKAASSEHTLKLGAKKLNNFEDLEASLTVGHVYAKDGFRKAELNTKGTYVGLKDTKLNGEFNFIDEKEDDGKTDKNMAVSLKAGANYKGVKNLELDGKFNFKYQVKGTSKVKDIITDSDIVLNKDAYAHSYELDAKYTGVKDLELTAGAFVQHIHFDNGSLENYASNKYENLYVAKLLSSDKEFFKHFEEKYKDAAKKLKEAQDELAKVDAQKVTAYNTAKKDYDDALASYKKHLVEEVKAKAKELADEIKAAATTENNKKALKEIEEIDAKVAELEAKKEKLVKAKELKSSYEDVKAEFKFKDSDETVQKKDVETLTKAIAKLTEEIAAEKAKKTTAPAGGQNLETKAGTLKGKYDAVVAAAKAVKDFKVETFNVDETNAKFKKENEKPYKYDSTGDKTAKSLYDTLATTDYAKAEKNVKDAQKELAKYDIDKLYENNVKNFVKVADGYYKAKLDLVNFGAKLGAKYTGVKNLTLTADGLFAGRYHSGYNQLFKFPAYTTGYVKLHAGAKYDFKLLNDKLVVSPEGNVTATFDNIYAGLCEPSLVLAPKVSVSYKPVDALKVSGSVEVPVNFGMKGLKEFGYLNTGIKGALNMRYEWK